MRQFWRSGVLAAFLLAIGLWGCAPRSDLETLNNNQLELRDMVAADRQRMEELDVRMRRLQDRIDRLKQGGDAGSGATRKGAKGLSARVARLEAAVKSLQSNASAATGLGPAMPVPTPGGSPPSEASSGASVAGLPAPETLAPGGASAASAPVSNWRDHLDAAIAQASGSSSQGARTYREGLNAMKSGNYQAAIARFAVIQKKYPKSNLVEPAEYFSANALFELDKYDQSILQFNDLVMRYPKGPYSSSALLREAQAFVRLNDKIDARLTLQKLLADHGGAPETAAANDLMKQLEN